jgi:hypothetical protein
MSPAASSAATLEDIARFIRVFDAVTTREAWQTAARRDAPAIAQQARPETCCFSAWDFHLPPEGGCWLIEFNDNGSGFLFAAMINALYFEMANGDERTMLVAPPDPSAFKGHLVDLVKREAKAFFGGWPDGLFFVPDDADSLRMGKFRKELELLRDLFRDQGWHAALGSPADTSWDGQHLLFDGLPVGFVVNRSTDFFWRSEDFSALKAAYEAQRVYVAPNPFSYRTRSDKRLLEWLSLPDRDEELGIQPEERRVLRAHMPETYVVSVENLEMLAQRKQEFAFKPLHGFAGRGLLDNTTVGRTRLQRLVRHGEGYVAQRWVSKPALRIGGATLWTDLRVWAYRGEIFNLSGRASLRPERLDLAPPGGWLPTYASRA